jgi:hypothetical protein
MYLESRLGSRCLRGWNRHHLDLHVHRPVVALKKDDSLLLLFEKLLQCSFEP